MRNLIYAIKWTAAYLEAIKENRPYCYLFPKDVVTNIY